MNHVERFRAVMDFKPAEAVQHHVEGGVRPGVRSELARGRPAGSSRKRSAPEGC
jgi:hypothetical protein